MTRFIVRDSLPSFSEVASEVAKSVTAIAVGLLTDGNQPNIIGTGFSVQVAEYFATCWHVAEVHDHLSKLSKKELAEQGLTDSKLRVALPVRGKYVWSEVEPHTWLRGWNADSDVCVYRLVGISLPPLTLHSGGFIWGDEVGVVGFPLGNRLQGPELRPLVLKTVIAGGIDPTPANQLKAGRLALGIGVAKGFSGGPVFSSADGRVVGMVASKPLEADSFGVWPAGLSLAVVPRDLHAVIASGIANTTAAIKEGLRKHLSEKDKEENSAA
jgi:S1-C subfamily serine protease